MKGGNFFLAEICGFALSPYGQLAAFNVSDERRKANACLQVVGRIVAKPHLDKTASVRAGRITMDPRSLSSGFDGEPDKKLA